MRWPVLIRTWWSPALSFAISNRHWDTVSTPHLKSCVIAAQQNLPVDDFLNKIVHLSISSTEKELQLQLQTKFLRLSKRKMYTDHYYLCNCTFSPGLDLLLSLKLGDNTPYSFVLSTHCWWRIVLILFNSADLCWLWFHFISPWDLPFYLPNLHDGHLWLWRRSSWRIPWCRSSGNHKNVGISWKL